MFGLSGPVRIAIASVATAFAGMSVYNLTQRPTTQTVQGISNEVLIAGAAAIVLVMYLRRKRS